MSNVSIDILRTLVAVADLRNYTRAAQFLGVTQPAVSTQIKRLQELLGAELFDKSAPGVRLSREGEIVLEYARRILSLNDELFASVRAARTERRLTIGIPSEFMPSVLPLACSELRHLAPRRRVHVESDASDALVRNLRMGELDMTMALSLDPPGPECRRKWREELVWVGAPETRLDPSEPIPLVTRGEDCMYFRASQPALARAGRSYALIATGADLTHLSIAVAAGFGVMPLPRRVLPRELVVCEDPSLPPLPSLFACIHLREGADLDTLGPVADAIARSFEPKESGASGAFN